MRSTETLPQNTPPVLFALLESPYGMTVAVVSTLPLYVLHAQRVSLEKAAAISALCLICLSGLIGGTILLPAAAHLQLLTVMLFACLAVAMLISAATGGMANQLGPDRKMNVGAWMQLGNLAANSLMMVLLVYAPSRCSRRTLSMLAMTAILMPGLAVLAVDEPAHHEPFGTFAGTMQETLIELKTVFLSWSAVPALLLLLSPIGNSSIASVLMGMTKAYHASDAQLTFANGWAVASLRRWERCVRC